MPKVIKNEEEGTEEELYTPDEYKALQDEKDALATEKTALEERALKAERVSAEKTENFKKLNEMTDEEKSKFTAAQLEDRKRIEAVEARNAELESKLTDKEKGEIESAKTKGFNKAGDNVELKTKLQANYDMLGLPEDTPANVELRMQKAWEITAATSGSNPINDVWDGAAPQMKKDKDEKEKFIESDKGKAALDAMGIEEKKPEEKKA